MRVHIYAQDFPISGDRFQGGLVKAVHGLAGGLVQNGARVTVLCAGTEPGVFRTTGGYEIRCFESTPAWRLGISLPPQLRRYIDDCGDLGVFLLNGVFNPSVYPVSRACARRNIPYLCWPHDPYTPALFASRRLLKWPFWYLRDRPMLRAAKGILVLDPRHGALLRNLGVQTPMLETVNGYAADDVIPDSMLRWRTTGPPSLVYLGRMDSFNKALDVLLDAFSEVRDLTDSTLTLQGPDAGDLQALQLRSRRLGLSGRVRFRGADLDRPAVHILAEHDVFMLPSRFEGFGLAALEAMLAARVLMVSEISGLAPHVLAAGCGVVVSPDVASVKAGLLQLLEARPRWSEMGMAGREYALEHFRWDRIAAQTVERYRQLLNLSPV